MGGSAAGRDLTAKPMPSMANAPGPLRVRRGAWASARWGRSRREGSSDEEQTSRTHVSRTKESSAGKMPPRRSEMAKASCGGTAVRRGAARRQPQLASSASSGRRTWLKAGPGSALPSANRSTNVRSSTHFCWTTKICRAARGGGVSDASQDRAANSLGRAGLSWRAPGRAAGSGRRAPCGAGRCWQPARRTRGSRTGQSSERPRPGGRRESAGARARLA